ncbi:LOW QUALITY PROTEIN: putative F-box/kelch-repeat protein At1g20790 [Solanum pennellii]|uniref:LOW QUALITY PROTEIN: putative F-box/kelch-repeat protein At1g20790 n=1 Tax=Solanum pennellii TaxID=28526 RepID=A0ABM1V5B4_SOLPN|nr:LOW QUALITY PROTEIN: putative F-box/kelch-repeat protein At1g20790 [Solanum pennellii]
MANDDRRDFDALRDVIAILPLKEIVQNKLLSKNVSDMVSHDVQFARILFNRYKDSSTSLIYTVYNGLDRLQFYKISFNPITQIESILPDDIELMASCNGLILIEFENIRCYCVFNPVTGEHQLVTYPNSSPNNIEDVGLAVEYPNADRYKLVAVYKLEENSNQFYKFCVLSSEQPGVWREIQVRTISFLPALPSGPHVYWEDSLYWVRNDGSVLAFDTKRDEATLINRPEFLDLDYDRILSGQDKWLGIAQGILTLVCIFRTRTIIATFDSANKIWTIFRTLDNFIVDQDGYFRGCPVWIDSKQVSFLVRDLQTWHYHLYECNPNTNVYETVAVVPMINPHTFCFHPTLASVHNTPYNDATADEQTYIATILNGINGFIIEDIPVEVLPVLQNDDDEEFYDD